MVLHLLLHTIGVLLVKTRRASTCSGAPPPSTVTVVWLLVRRDGDGGLAVGFLVSHGSDGVVATAISFRTTHLTNQSATTTTTTKATTTKNYDDDEDGDNKNKQLM